MDAQRKRINMRLPANLLNAIDNFCERSELARTTYFEMLARSDLKRRKIKYEKPKQPFIWHGAIEDMPTQIPERT